MAHKNKVTQEKVALMSTRWCCTPFAFASLGREFTLLQQQVLLRLSDHLQEYMAKFFKDGRHRLPDDPLSLFSNQDDEPIPPLKIPYASFGVEVNNRAELYKAIEHMMTAKIKGIVIDPKTGEPKLRWINVFKIAETDLTSVSEKEYNNGSVEFCINEYAAAYAFNMRRGYINHPSGIAEESTREYAPRLYFLIKHKIPRGKKEVVIKYPEVRKELGVDIVDKTTAEPEDRIARHLHSQYAKFVSRALEPACQDINRMADLNLLDIIVSYEPVYPEGVKRGDPDAIRFKVELSKLGEYHKDPKKALSNMDTRSSIAAAEHRKRGRPRKQSATDNTPSLFEPTPEAVLDQLDTEFGHDSYADLFGTRCRCEIADKTVTLFVPSSRVSVISLSDNHTNRINKAIADSIGEGYGVEIKSL